ncbi:MAG: oxidoreductase, partial [Planctomycetota bacterium]
IKAHIFVSWLHPYKEQKLVVVGSEGMLVFDDLTDEKLFLYPHRIEWKDGQIPIARKAEFQVIEVEQKEPLKEELLHFLKAMESRIPPITDGEEGLRVLEVLERAEKSLSSQKKKGVSFSKKESPSFFVHPTSIVDEGVSIGEGSKIWHFSHILKGSQIGKKCVLGQNVMVGPNVTIGDQCKLQNNVSVYKGVTLEDGVFCGPSCVFTNVYNPRAFIERKDEFRPTLVKQGATIGANATILCGTTIGKYAMVGAGALVRKDVPDFAIVVGVPARQVGWICKCGIRLSEGKQKGSWLCKGCGEEYYQKSTLKLISIEKPVSEKK